MQVGQFSMDRAKAFMQKFESNVSDVADEWKGNPDNEGYGNDIEVMTGRDEVLITFDREGHMTSGNFEHDRMYHRADSGNGTTTYSMNGRGVVEKATVNDDTREIVDFQSNKKGPAMELPGGKLTGGPARRAKVFLA